MSTSIDDITIDYDSSFEVVQDDEKFEKVESLDDTKSESFLYIPRNGETTKEVNIDFDDSIPITTSIIGKWKPISSNNLQDYFKFQKLSELNELAWEHGVVVYAMKDGLIHVHTELLTKTLSASVYKLGEPIIRANSSVVCLVENNSLNTVCVKLSDRTETWKMERYVKNGKLIIVNRQGEYKCERIYQRV